jgi:predicted phage-related endonuclease
MSDELPWRRDVLGASDAPAVVGVDPFRTAGDLWAEKTGRLPSLEGDGAPLSPFAIGKALEPLLMAAAARELDAPLASQVWYRHPRAPLACSVDGLALDADPPTLVEGKTCGILNRPARLLAGYGEPGTDELPDSVIVQVTHALIVLAAQPELPPIRHALVAALLGDGRGLCFYRLELDADLAEYLIGKELDFWRNHVEADQRPRDDPPSLDTLRRIRRNADLPPVPVDPVLVFEWQQAKAVLKQAEQNEETCRRFVVAELGDAEAGVCEHGRITYKPVARKGYTVAPTTVRQLRFKEAAA